MALEWHHEGVDDDGNDIIAAHSANGYMAQAAANGAAIFFMGHWAEPRVTIVIDETTSSAHRYDDRIEDLQIWAEERLAHFDKLGHSAADVFHTYVEYHRGDTMPHVAWWCGVCGAIPWTDCDECRARYDAAYGTVASTV